MRHAAAPGGKPGGDRGLLVGRNANDSTASVRLVLTPFKESLPAQIADQQAHRRRRDLQPGRQFVHGHRSVEERVGEQGEVACRRPRRTAAPRAPTTATAAPHTPALRHPPVWHHPSANSPNRRMR